MSAAVAGQTLSDDGNISGAEVAGYASGDVTRGSAFGVAIPAIDLVLNVIPSESAQMLQNRARDCFLDP